MPPLPESLVVLEGILLFIYLFKSVYMYVMCIFVYMYVVVWHKTIGVPGGRSGCWNP